MGEESIEIEENSKLKESENSERCNATLTLSKSKSRFKLWPMIMSTLMLIGPLLMGITIASIGNDEINGSWLPAKVWSIGFLYPFGGWFGSIIGAMTVEKWGRKRSSQMFCCIAMIGAGIKVTSKWVHIALLFLSRFFDGLSTSGLMVTAVLLMFETLPPRFEKYFKPLIQICVNLGILIISSSSMYSIVTFNWNYVHFITLAFALTLLIAVTLIEESPIYIFNKTKNDAETEKIFKNLRGEYYDSQELIQLKNKVLETSNIQRMSIIEFLQNYQFRFATITLIVLHIGQQLCGINAIMAFAPKLLKTAGFDNPDVSATIINSIAFLGSIIFAPFVGNFKRKVLWLIGFVFMLIAFSGFLICQAKDSSASLKLFFLCLFVFMFQIGPGPVVWFISVEMFPSHATGAAQGVAGFFNWFANTIVFLLFPILEDSMKEKVLIIFIVFQSITIVYSFIFVIETFGRKADDVLKDYQNKNFF